MTVTGTSTGAALRVQEERQERQRAIGVSGKNTIKDRTAGTQQVPGVGRYGYRFCFGAALM